MMAVKTLLDTDVLSGLMRGTPPALHRARGYVAVHGQLTLSLVTRFEILRGLKAKQATARQLAFDIFCRSNEVLPISEEVISTRGKLIPDADILIAATAVTHGLVLATNNLRDFGRIPHLQIDNWLAEP
jgi:tRNA(fMet)-specific endonuclease VapC